uniref:NADH-ubiquinone oxidoreductase chain 6 n=1 Tax=Trachelus tabidus TaxID=1001291 RepID=A0A1J0KEX8_9HYME|nr:NADH dehydrogenase subunit 6 [Trachelus tabidus]APC92684.1 NADH dehydrogenase subunit 6 [Trachelus tabidus]
MLTLTHWFLTSLKEMMTLNFILMYLSMLMISIIMTMKNNHPIELMIYLILFSIIMCLKVGMMYKNFWFSYMLFLTMIGGILILFLYFVSTASNEKMNLSKYNYNKIFIISISILIGMLCIMHSFDYFSINMIEYSMNNKLSMKMNNWSNAHNYSMFQMFNNNYKITLMMMIYLLFTLYSVMKMCMKMYGPLRQYL